MVSRKQGWWALQKLTDMFQEEVAHLRELLSLLKLEEESLQKGNREIAHNYFAQITIFNKKRYQLKRKRKEAIKKLLSALPIEVSTLLDQIEALEKTIRLQIRSNIQIKKKPPLLKRIDIEQLKKKKKQ